ncbi:MAG: 3-deoxy-8-phosphooctulonate synthase [Myxococcales bacterium]|nr:3-deoxy-8-phosphooctulonate synthase [Myxococcales bacterium]
MTAGFDGLPAAGNGAPLFFIAGPCVIEDEAMALDTARALKAMGLPLVFKASFDKANRSSPRGFRGPGLARGLEILARVKDELGLPILTDVHEPWQCEPAAMVADVLQIPAFLCRQTDLLLAAAATGRLVNVKRGQFLDPRRMALLLEKAVGARCWVTERGTAFGHGDLVFDPRSLVWMRGAAEAVIFDCTHSVQVPAGDGEQTGGRTELSRPLARAATAVGLDGIYAEVHPDPPRALSDSATQLSFEAFRILAAEVRAIDAARRAFDLSPGADDGRV